MIRGGSFETGLKLLQGELKQEPLSLLLQMVCISWFSVCGFLPLCVPIDEDCANCAAVRGNYYNAFGMRETAYFVVIRE